MQGIAVVFFGFLLNALYLTYMSVFHGRIKLLEETIDIYVRYKAFKRKPKNTTAIPCIVHLPL